jgi:soluble cytochrome b562
MKKTVRYFCLLVLLAAPLLPISVFAQGDHDSPLHEEMEGMGHALRLINRQYADLTQKASTLALVAEMQKHAETAKTLTPPKAAKMTGDQQTQYLDTFHGDLDKLITEIAALKQAITADQTDVAKAEIEKIGQLKQSSHKELGVGGGKHNGPPPGSPPPGSPPPPAPPGQ